MTRVAATPRAVDSAARWRILAGAAWVLFAVAIWVGWMISTRFGVGIDTGAGLTAWDITALRFLVAGFLLAPVVWKQGFGWRRLGALRLAVLVIGAGAPYVVIVTTALTFAPAAHGGALLPGTMPTFVAILAFVLLGERIERDQIAGLALTLSGVVVLIGTDLLAGTRAGVSIGHALLLFAAVCWASSTLAMRRGGLGPLHATAVVAVVSMLLYLPPYFVVTGRHLFALPLAPMLFHGFYQGVLTSIVSLVAYIKGITLLGAPRGAAFSALVPVLVAVLGIPLIGEWPTPATWIAVVLTALGVVMASGVARAFRGPAARAARTP